MPQVRYTTEQIIHKLREIEVVIAQGISVKQACRQCCVFKAIGQTCRTPVPAPSPCQRHAPTPLE